MNLEKLREEIARAMFDHEWSGSTQGVRDEVWQTEDKNYWLDGADVILAIPAIAERLK
jgi:hypothetical protein